MTKRKVLTIEGNVPPTPGRVQDLIKYTPTGLGIAAHGNFCGPNWSDGQFQGSVALGRNTTMPVDDLDSLCQLHDHVYAVGGDLKKADADFAKKARKLGWKGKMFAALVGAQGMMRAKGWKRRKLTGGIKVTEPEVHSFPIIDMRKYVKKRRSVKRRVTKRRTRSKPYRKRKVNKKRSSYRSRRTTRGRGQRNYTYSTVVTEFGETASDVNITFCGHGTTQNRILQVACLNMTKALFKAHGQTFADWSEVIQPTSTLDVFSYQAILEYQADMLASPITQAIISVPATMTYFTFAEDLQKLILSIMFTLKAVPVLQTLKFIQTDALETNKIMELARIELKRCKFSWNFVSSIRIQNQTANGAGSGVTDVNNSNPLQARVYYGKGGRNYMVPSWKSRTVDGGSTFRGWIPYDSVGAFKDGALGHMPDVNWRELPKASFVGAKSTKDFSLHPGQIVMDKLTARGSCMINTLLVKLFLPIVKSGGTLSDTQNQMYMGAIRAYGFDKLMWDRTENQPVKVGYEVNQQYSGSISFSQFRSQPITAVSQYVAP